MKHAPLRAIAYGPKLKELMQWSFRGDEALLEYSGVKLFGKPTTDLLGRHIFLDLKRMKSYLGANMHYRLVSKEDGSRLGFVAYTLVPMPLVHLGCIKRELRTDENKEYFLRVVEEGFKGIPYGYSVHHNNIRAIRFLENNGFKQRKIGGYTKMVMLCK